MSYLEIPSLGRPGIGPRGLKDISGVPCDGASLHAVEIIFGVVTCSERGYLFTAQFIRTQARAASEFICTASTLMYPG